MAAKPPPTPPPMAPPATASPTVAAIADGPTIQLGAFLQQANAERMQKMASKYGNITVSRKQVSTGGTMFLVRMGPFANAEQSEEMLDRLHKMGIEARTVKE